MSEGAQFFLWGVVGGGIVDGLEFVKLVRSHKGHLPKGFITRWYVVGELIRLSLGGVLSAGLFLSGEIAKPVAGIIVGVAAPAIVERWLREPPKVG
jgi:hypothetical protein